MNKEQIGTVALQGQRESFSYQAALKLFEPDKFLYRDSFAEVFEDLDAGLADAIVVPIENSTYGSVYENYDRLTKHNCQIISETYVRVSLYVVGLPETKLADIKQIYSHPVALGQIQGFRSAHRHVQYTPCPDTAGAVELVKQLNDSKVAACASSAAAESHGLMLLTDEIEDNKQNFTRFFAISRHRDKVFAKEANKTTVQFELGAEPGSLYKTLRSFADRNLALSRIESRPIINTDWNYRFYLDIQASYQQAKLKHALAEIKSYVKNGQVEILGSYPSLDTPQ